MSTDNQAHGEEVAQAMQESLNTHGYGFQYAVLGLLNQLRVNRKSAWVLERAEFPVEVRASVTRIDFVLQSFTGSEDNRPSGYYMLAECKRANPAYSDWCFIQAPYTSPYSKEGWIYLDRARLESHHGIRVAPVEQYVGTRDYSAYHIAIEVKGKGKGDRQGSAKGVIEEAVTQVLRGVNGMLEFLALHPRVFPVSNYITLVPVIFTTARLWVSDADLSTADLNSGDIDLNKSSFRQKPWLLYEYNTSPGLKHTQRPEERETDYNSMSEIMEREYVRSIAVVSSTGIESFLDWSHTLIVR